MHFKYGHKVEKSVRKQKHKTKNHKLQRKHEQHKRKVKPLLCKKNVQQQRDKKCTCILGMGIIYLVYASFWMTL